MPKQPKRVPQPAHDGISIHRNGATLGPYSESQVAEMVRDGTLSTVDLAWREGLAMWQPLFKLNVKGCFPSPPPTQDANAGGLTSVGTNQDNAFLQTLELQSRMKSKSVAVLLAIVFPFLGCLYSAPIAAIVCAITGTIMFATGIDGLTVILFSISYVASIFRALAGVERYNAKLIQFVRESGKV